MHKKREKNDSKNTKEYICAAEWAARLKKAQLEDDERIIMKSLGLERINDPTFRGKISKK